MVVLSVDVWHRLWREHVIDDIALTRITVITEISDLSTPSENLYFYFFSTNNFIFAQILSQFSRKGDIPFINNFKSLVYLKEIILSIKAVSKY